MAPSQLLWHLRRDDGLRAMCLLIREADAYSLVIQLGTAVTVEERYTSRGEALGRVFAIYALLREQGWTALDDHS